MANGKQRTVKERYMKERKRIQSFFSRYERNGYYVDRDILPNIPKNVTEGSIRRLQKLNARKLKESIYYIDEESGVFFEAWQRNSINKYKTEKIKEEIKSNVILENFMKEIEMIGIDAVTKAVDELLNDSIKENGKKNVAQALERMANDGYRVENYDVYKLIAEITSNLEKNLIEIGVKEEIVSEISSFINDNSDIDSEMYI